MTKPAKKSTAKAAFVLHSMSYGYDVGHRANMHYENRTEGNKARLTLTAKISITYRGKEYSNKEFSFVVYKCAYDAGLKLQDPVNVVYINDYPYSFCEESTETLRDLVCSFLLECYVADLPNIESGLRAAVKERIVTCISRKQKEIEQLQAEIAAMEKASGEIDGAMYVFNSINTPDHLCIPLETAYMLARG